MPRRERADAAGVGVAGGDDAGQRIGADRFLDQSDDENRESDREIFQRQAIRAMVGELRHDVAVVQDRPGDQMREKRNEQHIVQKVTVSGDAGFAVDQVADLGEREKRDAQRQDDLIDRLNGGNEMTDEADDGEQVFVIEQGGEIECDSGGGDPGLQAGSGLGAQDQPGDGIIGADRNQQQDDEGRVPLAIEHQRRGDQPEAGDGAPGFGGKVKSGQRDGQEPEDEHDRAEQHTHELLPSAASDP